MLFSAAAIVVSDLSVSRMPSRDGVMSTEPIGTNTTRPGSLPHTAHDAPTRLRTVAAAELGSRYPTEPMTTVMPSVPVYSTSSPSQVRAAGASSSVQTDTGSTPSTSTVPGAQ